MAFAKLTQAQANYLTLARNMSNEDRSAIRAELFRSVKTAFGIPDDHKLKVEIDDATLPTFLTLIRKKTNQPYVLGADGKWVDNTAAQGTVTQPQPPAVRWFKLDNYDAGSLLDTARDCVSNDQVWEDGVQHAPSTATYVCGTFSKLCVDEDGVVWVACEEADL